MSARGETFELMDRLSRIGIRADFDQANTLRRAEKTLHRWGEQECGNSNASQSWGIERDEKTDKPYMVIYPHRGDSRRYRIADREKSALDRVAKVCAALKVHYYHQTDPRGCALYVSTDPIDGSNYTNGAACCV